MTNTKTKSHPSTVLIQYVAGQITQHYTHNSPLPSYDEMLATNEAIIDYYNSLVEQGIPYGQIALEVAEGKWGFGAFAQKYFIQIAKRDGIDPQAANAMLDHYRILLANYDIVIRSRADHELTADEISRYHTKALADMRLKPDYWGGLLLEVQAGTGSWMDLSSKDTKPDINFSKLLTAIITNAKFNQTSAHEVISELASVAVNNAEDVEAIFFERLKKFVDDVIEHTRSKEFIDKANQLQLQTASIFEDGGNFDALMKKVQTDARKKVNEAAALVPQIVNNGPFTGLENTNLKSLASKCLDTFDGAIDENCVQEVTKKLELVQKSVTGLFKAALSIPFNYPVGTDERADSKDSLVEDTNGNILDAQ